MCVGLVVLAGFGWLARLKAFWLWVRFGFWLLGLLRIIGLVYQIDLVVLLGLVLAGYGPNFLSMMLFFSPTSLTLYVASSRFCG